MSRGNLLRAAGLGAMDDDIRLAVINGTGPPGPVYDEIMGASFCSQLGRKLPAKSFYLRGPRLFGHEVKNEAVAVYQWLKGAWEQNHKVRLMLAGYSRGGSAAIMACEMLEKDGIPVDSLFLFDAVAKHNYHGGTVIPANVRYSRHARRSLAPDFVEKYEGTIHHINLVHGMQNPIRPLFGNVGLTWHGSGDHQPAETFIGSHGALGGVGWRFVSEDSECEHAVAKFMGEHFKERGVEVTLDPVPPTKGATHPTHLQQWLRHNLHQFHAHHDEPHLSDLPPAEPHEIHEMPELHESPKKG